MKNKIFQGDAKTVLQTFPSECVDMCMTSPPYWALRDYGVDGQLGLESDFNEYISKLCDIFDQVKRVLKKEGTCWVNLGDTYYTKSGSGFKDDNMAGDKAERSGLVKANELRGVPRADMKSKSLVMIPFRFAIEMVNRGWILRNTLIWYKPNVMPSSASDRFTVDFEYLFFFSKSKKYYFEKQLEPSVDKESYTGMRLRKVGAMAKHDLKNYHSAGRIGVDGYLKGTGKKYPNRIKRTVWKITTKSFKGAHFAVYPEELCETPIKAGCPIGGIVLDPFFGAGTTGVVALKQDKGFVGVELSLDYIEIAKKRLRPYLEQTKLVKVDK